MANLQKWPLSGYHSKRLFQNPTFIQVKRQVDRLLSQPSESSWTKACLLSQDHKFILLYITRFLKEILVYQNSQVLTRKNKYNVSTTYWAHLGLNSYHLDGIWCIQLQIDKDPWFSGQNVFNGVSKIWWLF